MNRKKNSSKETGQHETIRHSERLHELANQLKMPDPETLKRSRRGFWLILFVLIIISTSLIYWRYYLFHPEIEVKKVRVENIQFGPVATAKLRSTGSTLYPTVLQARLHTSEPLVKKWVRDGDRVVQGQILLEFDASDLQIEMQKWQLELEQLEYERAQLLEKLEIGTTSISEMERIEFDIRSTQIQVGEIRKEMEELTYEAPFDGIVIDTWIEEGEIPTGVLLELAKQPGIWVKTEIRQEEIPGLKSGNPVVVMFEAIPEVEFSGKIRTVSAQADYAMGTVSVTLELLDPDPSIRSGYTARIFFTEVPLESNRAVYIAPGLPKLAISCQESDSGNWISLDEKDLDPRQPCEVWISMNGRAQSSEITIGQVSGDWVEILQGVSVGDEVIYSSSLPLREGMRVFE